MNRREFLACALAATPAEDFVQVSPRCSRYLELSSKSPYIPVGLNMVGPPKDGLDGLLNWMTQLADHGGNYVRFWLSYANWDLEPESAGVYDEEHAALVKRALDLARRRGIRVKMTIEHFRSIGEGRQPWADKPLHNRANGGTATDMEDWLANPESRAQFRGKLEWLAKTFGHRPEIFGWELWNEVNAVRARRYLEWTGAMLPSLHQAFPANLCMQSLGSFDNTNVDPVYKQHSLMAGNDLALVHRYLDLGAPLELCHGPVDVFAADAVKTLLSYKPDKPVLLAESGAVEPRHTGPFQLYAKDKAGVLLHDVLFAPFFAGAAGSGQIWHWDAYVAANDLWHHFGRFADFVKGLDPAAEQFEPSMIPHPRLRIYQLAGRRTTLLWLRDSQNDWRSELERSEVPETLRGIKLPFKGKAEVYDPWTGEWARANTSHLPEFRRSLCLKISRAG